MKKLLFLIYFLLLAAFVPAVFAQDNSFISEGKNSFISIVNPVRGNDFWDLKDQKVETAVAGQVAILDKFNLPATWLIRFDAFGNQDVIDKLKLRPSDEEGIFLEVTPTWAAQAKVAYRKSASWHSAASAFLTGYEQADRERLIDTAFEKFKSVFGYYPASVGAWWIDSYSLGYMQKKYGIVTTLIVADQYSTDNYQIWGQYFGTPYYPTKNNALHPAQTMENKLDVVMTQWALRDPVNSYGNGVMESTFSVQANDYTSYHNLDTNYFSRLIDTYTKQQFNQFAHVVVGLENSYDWGKYSDEYQKQIKVLAQKRDTSEISIIPLKDFASWYRLNFPRLSPEQIIIANDPLGSFKKAVWFMNPYYRAAWFYTVSNGASSAYNADGSVFRDIRQYVEGEEEMCFQKSCNEVNFATFATRVLDEVTYGHKWVIDEGKISNFKVLKSGENFVIKYLNGAGKERTVEFLPRDISVDGKISSIDATILNVIKQDNVEQKKQYGFKESNFSWSAFGVLSKTIRFLLFLLIACLLPGLVLVNRLFEKSDLILKRIFLAVTVGFVLLTVIFYLISFLNLRFLIFVYILSALLLFLRLRQFSLLKVKISRNIDKLNLVSLLVIILGTVFQNIPTFRSGLMFPFGMGFWGPNTHDGIWHVSLINELLKGIPVDNPIFAGTVLKNYHFFYDLLIATAAFFTKIPVIDLVFRFFPILFSLLLGIGTYYLVINLFSDRIGFKKTKIAVIFSLYFVYFAGSFGWIVDYIKQKSFGGESAFWANQSISFNLNPPFAVSLLIIIAFLFVLSNSKKLDWNGILVGVILSGSLVGFKAYGAVLVITALFFISIFNLFKKEFSYLFILIFSSLSSLLIFLSNFQSTQQLMIFSPFWFIHSMIDSADRVGWTRLSLARVAGLETKNWFKFISVEVVSLFLFIVGNLGVRVLSIFSLLQIRNIIKHSNFLFILIFSLLSFLIPIFFIQSGTPWNTIQFSYYGLYTTALVSGVVFSSLVLNLPKVLSIVILVGLLILTPINSITTSSYYLGIPHAIVNNKELEALEFLSKQTDGIVLTYPYNSKLKQRLVEPWSLFAYDSTAYVAALSNKSVFVEDEPQNQILLTDYKKRIISSKDFFLSPGAEKVRFLSDNNIKYIYLPKIFDQGIDESLIKARNIFENEEVAIYKVR